MLLLVLGAALAAAVWRMFSGGWLGQVLGRLLLGAMVVGALRASLPPYLGVHVGLNPVTAATVGFLGLPGLVLLTVASRLFG